MISAGAVDEVKTIGTSDTFKTSWNYNSADMVTAMVYPEGNNGENDNGETVTYSYDYRMLLNTVSGTDNYVTGTSYDASGRVEQRSLGNGLQTSYDYFNWDDPAYVLQNGNTQGRLAEVQTGTTLDPDALQDLTYSYDPVGNVTGIADALAGPQSQTFTYDTIYRLTQGYTTGGLNGNYNESYTYDATTGNLSSKAGVSYGYQDSNHFHAVTHLDSVQKYWYDANGNMTDRVVGSDTYDLTYDAENRLVEVEKNQTTVGEYTYDGDGSRVKSVAGGVTTLYIGNYYEWRVETSGSTAVQYYYAGSQRVAMREGGTLYYLFGDHLGSTSLTTDASGNLTAELRYLPFGETRYENGQTPTSFRYTGQREDSYINLYWYNSRWYDPVLGRWAQPDTIIPNPYNPQSWDRFGYVLNNPIRYSDPSGHVNIEGTGGGGLSKETLDYYWKSKAIEIVTDYEKKQNEEGLTVFWGGLSDQERCVLEKAGWNGTTFEEGPGVTKADALHDPVVWLVTLMSLGKLGPSTLAALENTGAQTGVEVAQSSQQIIDDLLSKSQKVSSPSGEEVYRISENGSDALNYFGEIADSQIVEADQTLKRFWVDLASGGRAQLRLTSSFPSTPVLDLHNIPGYIKIIKIHFYGE